MYDWINLQHIAAIFQILDDCLARLETIHPAVLAGIFIQRGVLVHRVEFRQVVTLANQEVVWIMSRRNLNHPSTKFRRYVVISNDFDLTVDQRHHNMLADQFLVAFIIWVYGNGLIAKHGFRTRRSNFNVVFAIKRRAVGKWIFNVVEGTLVIFVDNLHVGKRRPCLWVPVDNVGCPVDQSLIVQINENLANRFV